MSQRTRPRIALVIHALYGGGAERLMAQLASRWSEHNEVHLITWATTDTDGYPIASRVQRVGLGLQRPSRTAVDALLANGFRVRRLRALLRQLRPDFILSFSDQMNIVCLEATRGMGVPRWIAEHSDPAQQRLGWLWERWRRRSYPTCSGCVVLTPAIAESLRWLIPRERLQVIPPAIEPPALDLDLDLLPGNEPQREFLFLGRLSHEKGIDILLDGWRRVQRRLPDWRLTIAGDGGLRHELERQGAELERVTFTGWQSTPWPSLSRASVFVLPSRYEGFPVALLEAMSQAKGCIVTRCSAAVDELNRDGRSLQVVDVAEPEQLADAMYHLATDATHRQEMGSRAQQVSTAYHWSQIGPRWDQLLSRL